MQNVINFFLGHRDRYPNRDRYGNRFLTLDCDFDPDSDFDPQWLLGFQLAPVEDVIVQSPQNV